MQVAWTEAALADLDEVLAHTAEHYPSLVGAVERRIRAVVERIGRWPESAQSVFRSGARAREAQSRRGGRSDERRIRDYPVGTR